LGIAVDGAGSAYLAGGTSATDFPTTAGGFQENPPAKDPGVPSISGFVAKVGGAPEIGPPTDKNQCKNGGWQRFNNPTFRNQGQCVSFVARRR
jgi:hypothetical protein